MTGLTSFLQSIETRQKGRFFYVYYVESEQLQRYSVQGCGAVIVGKLQIKRKIEE
ncbi:hypothetical protein F320042A7_18660 [Blautia producta]